MPITAEAAQRVALETLGFDEFPPHIGGLNLVNQAGEWLVSPTQTGYLWRFLDGAETSLGTTAGQPYISLPNDFQGIGEVASFTPSTRSFSWSTTAEILRMRAQDDPVGGYHYFGAISYRDDADGQPAHVLELYPTPQATQADVFLLKYRRGWRPLTADTQRAAIPGWMDALYLEAVRAFARGVLEEDQGSLSDRLQALAGGNLMASAVRRDSAAQMRYGVLSGGAAQQYRTWRTNPLFRVTGP